MPHKTKTKPSPTLYALAKRRRLTRLQAQREARNGFLLILACFLCLIVPPIVKAAQTPVSFTYDRPSASDSATETPAAPSAPPKPAPALPALPAFPSGHLTAEQVETRIRALALKASFPWPDYLVRLAKCESGLRPDNKNTRGNVPSTSVDRGLFQINSYYHAEVSDAVAFDIEASTEWAMWRIESGHQGEWACDSIIKK